jgi:hypothetical protein
MQSYTKILGIALVMGLGGNMVCAKSAHAQMGIEVGGVAVEAIGQVWSVIEANKPVSTAETQSASALPQGVNANWQAMSGWKPDTVVHASLPLKNHYGVQVVDLEYDVRVIAGGNFKGKGAYIASVQVIPTSVRVSWSYNLAVKVTVSSVYNAGTPANPVAAMVVNVDSEFGSLTTKQTSTSSFLVRGEGLIQHVEDGEILAAAGSAY